MKRIIFTLLFENGHFIQSRNFRRQRVGNINWLLNNYDFTTVSQYLDEIMIIDLSSDEFGRSSFLKAVKQISEKCFVPITVGGKIRNRVDAEMYYRSGADKIFINNIFLENRSAVTELSNHYGAQAIVAGTNYVEKEGSYYFADSAGNVNRNVSLTQHLDFLLTAGVGEVILQAIHRDGTGFGADLTILNLLPAHFNLPVIIMGGIGNGVHIVESLGDVRVDAVATANLLNFIGDAFLKARILCYDNGVVIPNFNLNVNL